MCRVIAKTTAEITANIEGDRIEETADFFKVYKGNELVGAFDVGSIIFIYKTKSIMKGSAENDT